MNANISRNIIGDSSDDARRALRNAVRKMPSAIFYMALSPAENVILVYEFDYFTLSSKAFLLASCNERKSRGGNFFIFKKTSSFLKISVCF